jgi:pimeloyl-ACP methyl ester carboxylesterase
VNDSSVVSRIAHESCARAPSLLTKGYWWDDLDRDFARRPEGFDLALADRLRVAATASVDTVLRTAAASMISSLALPFGYNPIELRKAIRDMDFYADIAESGDPTRFFATPPTGVRVRAQKGRWLPRFEPDDGSCEAISFDSPFQPVNPRQHKPYLRHDANRVARARLLRHRGDEPRPTIVAIHGFTADWYLINEWFFALPWFYRMGCNVALFTLPFHGPRQTRFSPFSGHGYFAGGSSRLNEAVAQSVFDFRILFDWLQRERGAEQIGVTGLSLGGFTAAMLASVEDRLSFAIPNVPVVSLADLVLEWQPIGLLLRGAMSTMGTPFEEVRRMVAVSCPLSYAPVLPPERLMIVAGVGDRLAPPKHSRLLWDHWNRCRIHWFPGSHTIHMDRGVYLTEMARFMVEAGFLPQGDLSPKTLR